MSLEKEYLIPESQLIRLLETCHKANSCKDYGHKDCECSNQSLLSDGRLVIGIVEDRSDTLLESEFN